MYVTAQQPREEAWEHDGICECGKRTYLYPQCPACIEATAKVALPPPDTVAAANSAQGRDIWRIDPPHGRWIRCHFIPRCAFFVPRAGAGIPHPDTLHPVRDTFMNYQDGSSSHIRAGWTVGSSDTAWTGESYFYVTSFPVPPCPLPRLQDPPPPCMDYWVRTVGGRVRRTHVLPRTTLYAPVSRRLSPALLYRQRIITGGVDCATMQAFELLDDWQSHGAEVPAAWVGHTEFVLRAVHVPRAPPSGYLAIAGDPMAVLEIYSAQLETCLLTPVYDRLILLICQGQDLLMAYALWQPQSPLQVSHTTGAVADTLPPYRITIALSKFAPPFLVQACQSWHWSPDLVLQWPTLSRATHDWQHWGGLHH